MRKEVLRPGCERVITANFINNKATPAPVIKTGLIAPFLLNMKMEQLLLRLKLRVPL
jgi:hypothetical protein